MFHSYEFSFDSESSLMYGLMLYDFNGIGQSDVPFGNKAEIIETRTNNRVQPIHFGVNYHASPLQFRLVFGAIKPLDRFELEDISLWLTGQQEYKWLSIGQPDLEHVQFRCIITELKPLSYGWLPYAFEATVTCDCPYAYGLPFEKSYQINGNTDILFRNESTVREYLKPLLTVCPTAEMDVLRIINHSDGGRMFLLQNIPASSGRIVIDNHNGIIQETTYGYNLYDGFNLNFFRLVHGDNHLTVTGSGTLCISGRFYHNVAG